MPERDHLNRCKLHHVSTVEEALSILNENPQLVNARDVYQCTPLHYVASEEIASLMIIHGAYVNATDNNSYSFDVESPMAPYKDLIAYNRKQQKVFMKFCQRGLTPLHYAVAANKSGVADILLQYGSVWHDARNEFQMLPMHFCWSASMLRYLLRQNGVNLQARNYFNQSILHILAANPLSEPEAVSLCIDLGIDPNDRDIMSNTPLHYCKSPRVARLLLEKGAIVTAVNSLSETVLHTLASIWSNSVGANDLILLFVQHGVDINAWNKRHRTALHIVQDEEVAVQLINHGASVNAGMADRCFTPLFTATSAKVAKVLLAHNAQFHEVYECVSPVVQTTNSEVASLLLDFNSDYWRNTAQKNCIRYYKLAHNSVVQMRALRFYFETLRMSTFPDSEYPLHIAKSSEVVQFLLDHGCTDVNQRHPDHFGTTPLHEAQDSKVAEILLRHGADVNALNEMDCSPLHYARDAEIFILLLQNGADIHLRNSFNGGTPLTLFIKRNYQQTAYEIGKVMHYLWLHGLNISEAVSDDLWESIENSYYYRCILHQLGTSVYMRFVCGHQLLAMSNCVIADVNEREEDHLEQDAASGSSVGNMDRLTELVFGNESLCITIVRFLC